VCNRPVLRDRLLARALRLPGGVRPYRVDRGLRVPLRDGVTLAADHYAPAGEPAGTVLVRGPYGRRFPFSSLYARPYAAAGYHVLFVSSRGTAASGGEFDPMRTERPDGVDVVDWLTAQPWFTGTFGTVGPSYLGYTQWTLLADPPPQMAAAVITVGPHDFARHSWGTGAFALDLAGWTDMIINQPRSDERTPADGLARLRRGPDRRRQLDRIYTELPLADAGDRWFAGRAPWWRERVTRPDLADPYWEPMRHPAALDRADIPILLLSGWQDMFLEQTVEQYDRLRARGVDVALSVGPWAHTGVIGAGSARFLAESLEWLGEKLGGGPSGGRPAAVRVQVTGAREWRALDAWPPPTTQLALHPDGGGGLAGAAPPAGSAAFTFDPADPTPTVGGPLLDGGGRVDDSALARRADVLAFTGEPLTAGVEIAGAPVAELWHRSDNPHADLFVRISDVDTRGRSRNVAEGFCRLATDRDPAAPVRLPLRPTAHRFRAGHRIRLIVAGGSHPQFARNLGTGANPGTGSSLLPARHTVQIGPSRVLLPVTPAAGSPPGGHES
jgi:uncharacterized protein